MRNEVGPLLKRLKTAVERHKVIYMEIMCEQIVDEVT